MATPLDMIEAHLTWMRAGKYATNTISDARKLLGRLHRELPAGIDGALGEELAAWLATDGWSDQTVATYYKHIVRFYRWAAGSRDPWLSYDPSADLRRPTARRGLPRPALPGVVQAAIFDLPDPWRLACRLTALAGLRPCEVAAVTRADVTRDWITIKGKGGKTRAVPTHALIWELVEPMPAGPLVRDPQGRPVDAYWVGRTGATVLRRAGLNTTLYPLRHYFGTQVQATYRDVRVTQALMGHASLDMTAVYTQVTDDRLQAAIGGAFSALDAGTAAAPSPGTRAPADADPGSPAPRVDVPPRQLRPGAAGRRVGGRVVRSRSRPPRHR
ncbi:tyrosine-type recombinase/integrase [Micromonospora sp. WMMD1102]|uniref:tyrosine-type recombinase/integrase n=1 Tax=Micromonospora sp. WMMD1102 TaxID=3016105 RepID=UPI0024157F3E|nr:tyrosine-type recombinase/integrase [Micromonospora sp. WMMD1102]MDG4784447.1 tyrosine-type recombinase/integrase [Micromonospora sp. WMMD1102]